MNVMQKWMSKATPKEQKQLARLAGTTLGTLRQIAGAYRTDGALAVSAGLAARIERGTVKLERAGLGIVLREKLCPACGACEFAKQSRKG